MSEPEPLEFDAKMCPECRTLLRPKTKFCGGMVFWECKTCGFHDEEMTGIIDFGTLFDWTLKEAQFRRIIRKAMIHCGLTDIDGQSEFLRWLIGKDCFEIPYMAYKNENGIYKEQDNTWLSRIKENAKLHKISAMSSVYDVIVGAVGIWQSKKILTGAN